MKRIPQQYDDSSRSQTVDGREVRALLDASRAASDPIDLPSALRSILDAALGLLQADEGSIQLLDPASHTLWIAAARGIPDEIVRGSRVHVGEGVSGRVASTGQAVILRSTVDIQQFTGFVAKERAIHGSICVPLKARGGTIGVLNLDLMTPGRVFTERELDLALLFADNASHAIVGRQLLDRAERQAVDVEALRRASAGLTAILDLDALADQVLDRMLTLAGTGEGLICLAGEDGAPITLARYRGLPRESVKATVATPEFRELLGLNEARLIPHPLVEATLAPLAETLGGRQVLVLPAAPPDGEHTGVVIVAITPPVEPKVRLLRAFAPEAALALGNAILHRRVITKEQELETIVMSVPLPIILVDGGGCFRAVNPAAAEIFRLTPEFEIGETIEGKLDEQVEELLFAEEEIIGREVIVTVGNMPHAYRASVTGVRLDGGDVGGRVLVLYDVTAQRELEQRKADFLAVIGHELRTPLTSIRGFTSTVLRNGDSLDPKVRTQALERVMVQAQRLERLIEDLLYVSHIERHKPPLRLAWDDAVSVVTDVVEEFRRREPERPIVLNRSLPEMPVKMDRVKVEQILYHLLDNALKYSEPQTKVRVSVLQQDDQIEISVKDEGVGIYSGDLPRLFRAFGQLDSSATRKHGGTGIGLHVCKTLVDTFGGRIWADSMLGKGSTFVITIPRVPPDDGAATQTWVTSSDPATSAPTP